MSEQSIVHVALVGMTGVGKSTLVNVLLGQNEEIAEVNNNARPCTPRSIMYETMEGGTKFCIWDTRGINEASEQEASWTARLRKKIAWLIPDAESELKMFLRGSDPKVDLVLLCVDVKKIKVRVHWKIYNKIYVELCERRLKVAVVVTQMGKRDFRGLEWKSTCRSTALQEGIEGFPDASLIEAVPKFEELGDPIVKECKGRVLGLISNACRIRRY